MLDLVYSIVHPRQPRCPPLYSSGVSNGLAYKHRARSPSRLYRHLIVDGGYGSAREAARFAHLINMKRYALHNTR